VSAINKFQITKHKYQMVRQAHHLTTLSQVEGQITITETQNSKQLAFDLICNLDIVIWILFGPILRSGGVCILLFPIYQGLGPK
jgi:hypothetical protein